MANAFKNAGAAAIGTSEVSVYTTPSSPTTTVIGLTLFEDIFSMTVSGTISITDSVNLASYGPLLGQEY